MTDKEKLSFDESLRESPRISGTRISAIQVYEMHVLKGLTAEEVAGKYEIEEEAVKQALRYCRSHPDEVREQATSQMTVEIVERQSKHRKSASA